MTNLSLLTGRTAVLVVDDEPAMRTALHANFARAGWGVETAGGVHDAMRAVQRRGFDLIVTDVRMRDGDGFQLLESIQAKSPGTPVILLTAYGSVPEAVQSMRGGALDYLTKPISFEQLLGAATRILAARTSAVPEARSVGQGAGGTKVVGRSPALLKTLSRAHSAASTGSDILIEAESGTGKEVMARYIHESSARRAKPFIAINCAAVPEALLETELFGHARGAFTGAAAAKAGKFELAHGGTLLLDEIGEMPLALQPKLLRVLQEREFERVGDARSIRVDIRIIATTNASLAALVEQGKFRGDLYYRLNVIPLTIPPLRERGGDIAVLAHHFAEAFARESGRRQPVLDASFLECLEGHRWPGNVRELANFMRRVLSLHSGEVVDAAVFREEFRPVDSVAAASSGVGLPGTPIAMLERMHVEKTLAMANGNRTRAAEMLGISLRTMRNKIREYGLPPRSYA